MRLDQLDYMDICRDEDCDRSDLHSPVECGSRRPSVVNVPARRLILDITLEAVSARIPKTFAQIYTDVLDEYGSITSRNVNVALATLRDAREIAFIVPNGSQHVVHTSGVRGAYIRYDSPLLWQRDGLVNLMDVVHEMIGDGKPPPRRRHVPRRFRAEELAHVN